MSSLSLGRLPVTQSLLMGESLLLHYCIVIARGFPVKIKKADGLVVLNQSIDFSITTLPIGGSKVAWFLLNWLISIHLWPALDSRRPDKHPLHRPLSGRGVSRGMVGDHRSPTASFYPFCVVFGERRKHRTPLPFSSTQWSKAL